MLKHLYIRNYALIQELDLDLRSGFSVITGETGAGKSILLGAIGLLLGQRADARAIQQGAKRCIIEAQFDISNYNLQEFFDQNELDFDDQECIIRRELTDAGKSRAFINDTPATVQQLRQLGEQLIDIHSQHQNLLLGKEDFQLNILDIMGRDTEVLNEYKALYQTYRQTEARLNQLRKEASKNASDLDYLSYQLQQLKELNPQEGEDEELQQEAEILSHAEDIKSSLYQVSSTLDGEEGGILSSLRQTRQTLQSLSRILPDAQEMADRVDSAYIDMKDLCSDVQSRVDEVDYNPARLEEINARLDQLYTLEQKHHVDNAAELKEIQDDLRQKVGSIENADADIAELEKQVQVILTKVQDKAKKLTTLRAKAAKAVEKEMSQRLIPLGIPNARFVVEIVPLSQPGSEGMDHVTFLFSANKNATPNPISQVASGGEIARIMLSLKALISNSVNLPTIIFDEIDTGVSGRIAECMAQTMQQMGQQGRQVISITHLPQIAALGTSHYYVYKEDTSSQTISHIRELSPEERVEEIAHMLSGADLTQAAIDNAKQLLRL